MPVDGLPLNPTLRMGFARLRQSAFVRNMLIVMSGNVLAQAVGLALSPVISRLFSPADFGVFGSFNAVLLVFTGFVTLDYSLAIMVPKEKVDAFNLFIISCLSTIVIGLGTLAACLVASSFFLGLIKSSNAWLLGLLVLAVTVGGLKQTFYSWCVRGKAFKRTSASQAVRGVAASGMQFGLGCFKAGAPGLIISGVAADSIAILNLLRSVIPDFLAYRHAIQWKRLKKLAVEYRDFPIYSASQNVVSAVSGALPVLLLGHYYGIAVAGAYVFGGRLLTKPVLLISNSLRQVLYQKAGETQHRGGRLTPLYLKTTLGLFAIAALPSLVLLLWAPPLFAWVFGAQWYTAGEFTRWLALGTVFSFCNLPAVLTARLIRIQHLVFYFNLVVLAANAAVLVLGGLYLTAVQTVLWFALVSVVMNPILILLVGYVLQKKEKNHVMPADLKSAGAILSPDNSERD